MLQNKTVGAIFLVAGTTIGAGMLGLPIVAAQFGLIKSIMFLLFMWAVMCYSAILMLKVLSNFGESVSVAKLGALYYGRFAEIIGGSAIIVLFMSLLTAYISASSGLIAGMFEGKAASGLLVSYFSNKNFIAFLITAAMLALFLKRIKAVDIANRIIFIVKVVSLAFTLVFLASKVNYSFAFGHSSLELPAPNFFAVTLIFFITFGFHGSIPALLKYLDNDYKKARFSMIIGSLIPLALFIFWTLLTLFAVYSQDQEKILEFITTTQELNAFKALVSGSLEGSYSFWLDTFMLSAIFTSYFGVALGLVHYIKEFGIIEHCCKLVKVKSKNAKSVSKINCLAHIFAPSIVMLVPFFVSLFSDDIFIRALSLGAAMLSIIAIIFPSMVAIKMHFEKGTKQANKVALPLVFLNLVFGILIVLFEFL